MTSYYVTLHDVVITQAHVITELELKLQQLNKEVELTSSTHSKVLLEKVWAIIV